MDEQSDQSIKDRILSSAHPSGWAKLVDYLNGTVDLGFLKHPIIRWIITVLLALYVIVGLIVGWKVYKVKSESVNIRRILVAYPLPAVLMPSDIILVRDYLNQLRFIRHFAEKTKQALPADKELGTQLINQMIETELLVRTGRKYGIKLTRADIDAAYKKISDENGGPGELQKLLTDLYGMNEKEFRLLVRDQLLREKAQKEVLLQIHAKHILIKDEKKAKDVLDTLKKDPSKFDELAKQQSEDVATRDKAGDLGFFSRGVMTKAFEDAAYGLKENEITQDLVKTEFGFHIIKVIERKGRVDKNYKDFLVELKKNQPIWILLKP